MGGAAKQARTLYIEKWKNYFSCPEVGIKVIIKMFILIELKSALRRIGMIKEKVDLFHRWRFWKTYGRHVLEIGKKVHSSVGRVNEDIINGNVIST